MKNNIFIIIGAAVVVVMVGIVGFLLYGEIGRFAEATDKLERATKDLGVFYANKPFPSDTNVKVEKRNVQVCSDWFAKLVEDLRKGEIKVEQVNPAIYLTIQADTVKQLVEAARKASTRIPTGFQFGFSRYEAGVPPAPTDVTRVNEQLLLVQMMCQVLFDEGVSELMQVTREEFEGQKALPGSGATAPGTAPGPRRSRDAGSAGAAAVTPGVSGLHTHQRFSLEFKAKESSLISILNRFSKLGPFVVVNCLDLQGDSADVKPAPPPSGMVAPKATNTVDRSVAGLLGLGEAEAPAKDPAPAPLADNALLRDERIVSGPTLETPMKIRLDVDVYKFKPVAVAAKPSGGTP